MPKLKVVRVVTASYVVPWHLANTLRRMPGDFEVTVVGQGVSANKDEYPNVHWLDIDLNRKISVIADLHSLWKLCRFFWAYKPDVVHSIMPKAGLLGAFAGFICRVPIRIHTFTGQTWINRKPAPRFFLCMLDRIVCTLNTVCLTDSPSQSSFLHRHHISNAGRVLPVLGKGSLSGVEISRFDCPGQDVRRERLRDELGIRKNDFVFAFIARKSRDKGAIDMLSAFSRVASSHPEARLLFVGPDESEGALQALRSTSPLLFKNVIDVGQVAAHESYLGISSVLCLPSYREGFGSIVIDAAAARVPTIGSNIIGLIDSIEDGVTGTLVRAGDIDGLVLAMLSMIEYPTRCKEMGATARRRVETFFTADQLYASLRNFYHALLADGRR
jgi:glycosyltransferase involved in cell wall biosynthesis